MGLEKLRIYPLDESLRRKQGVRVEAMYNPKEVTIDSSAQFQRTSMPGLEAPVTQFVSGQTQTVSMSLIFDSYEARKDVRDYTAEVVKLIKIDPAIHAPPVCELEWGTPLSPDKSKFFRCVFDKVNQKFTMFLESGIPVRATLSVNISEYRTIKEQLTHIRFESADRSKRRVLSEKTQLWHLADKEYGNLNQWRFIADANNIENPRLLNVGQELLIPPLPEG